MGTLRRFWDRITRKNRTDKVGQIHEARHDRHLSDQAVARVMGASMGAATSDKAKALTKKERRHRRTKRRMARASRKRNRA